VLGALQHLTHLRARAAHNDMECLASPWRIDHSILAGAHQGRSPRLATIAFTAATGSGAGGCCGHGGAATQRVWRGRSRRRSRAVSRWAQQLRAVTGCSCVLKHFAARRAGGKRVCGRCSDRKLEHFERQPRWI
jgi:hypothetical protein